MKDLKPEESLDLVCGFFLLSNGSGSDEMVWLGFLFEREMMDVGSRLQFEVKIE